MDFAHWMDALPPFFHQALKGVPVWQWLGVLMSLALAMGSGALLASGVRRWIPDRFNFASRSAKIALLGFLTTFLFDFFADLLAVVAEPLTDLLQYSAVVRVIFASWLLALIYAEAIVFSASHSGALGDRSRRLILPFFQRVGMVAIMAAGVLTGASMLNFNLVGVLTGLGIGGVALALAAKDSVENFFGSITVLVDMPFRIGDWIKVDDIEGAVEEINLRSSRIRTGRDTLVTLPNSMFIKTPVENFGLRRTRRFKTSLVWETTSAIADLRAFSDELADRLKAEEEVKADSVTVGVSGAVDYGIETTLSLNFYVPSYEAEIEVQERTLLLALELGARHNLLLAHRR